MSSVFRQLMRNWHFARFVPAHQLFARVFARVRRTSYRLPILRPVPSGTAALRKRTKGAHFPVAQTVHRVSKLPSGWQVELLGHQETMNRVIDWSCQPDIPSNQLWRMTLHYMEWLEQLGLADGVDAILNWISANPSFRGGWEDAWHPYTMSLRTVAWLRWLDRHSDQVSPDRLEIILQSLALQLLLIEANPETDVRGNHIIKNIKALLFAAELLECAEAKRWRDVGFRLLKRELAAQILPDGCHFELSPSYHCQVFADLLEIRLVTGESWFDDRLAAMAHATALLCHSDGQVAQFNDSGLSMTVPPGYCLDLWDAISGKGVDVPVGGFALPQAGYYGFRASGWSLIADLGRIGPDALPAHAHADIGSFELSLGSKRMIVDQGVFEYVAGATRDQSRATSAHNCLTLADQSQADMFGAFRCGRRPDVLTCTHEATVDKLFAMATHNGFDKVKATRSFHAAADTITICDRLSATPSSPVRLRFLLHPECEIADTGTGWKVTRQGAAIEITASGAREILPAVWWPDMGCELPAQRLCLTLAPGCFESETIIRILACA